MHDKDVYLKLCYLWYRSTAWPRYVLCTRDKLVHSVDLSSNPALGYKRLAGPFPPEGEAQQWKFNHCRKFQPNPPHPPDWLSPVPDWLTPVKG